MRRTIWALAGAMLVTVFVVTGCGNLKKDEFLPEYEQYKAENADRFTTVESSIDDANMRVDDLEAAVTKNIAETNEETLAAVEQGDADTLAGAKSSSSEMDSALRDELSAAIESAAAEAAAAAEAGDEATSDQIMATMDEARSAVMDEIEASTSKSASDAAALRMGIGAAIRAAVPTAVATVHFGTASAKLSDEAIAALADAVSAINERPDACVNVVGHADSRPILSGKYLTNLQLSEARAQAVADYLTEQGVTNDISVSGRGHFATTGSQASEEGQTGSRRVEISLVEM